MTTRSSQEVKDEYLIAMGQDLGPSFVALHTHLIELHILWQQYRQLYGSEPEIVHLLNRTSGLFFKIVQDELWDSVLLGISRMTDPPNSSGRKNLTLFSLPPQISDPSLRLQVEMLCEEAKAEASFARDHRNKRIAHSDHNYLADKSANPLNDISRERVEAMLSALRKVLNLLNLHFCDSTTMYEMFVSTSGADLLVHKLRKFERLATNASAP